MLKLLLTWYKRWGLRYGRKQIQVVMKTEGGSAMTKADIVERIYEKVGFSKKEATDVVESIFEIIKGHLEQGEKIKISGFGNFVLNSKRPRKGRNPQTGEEIVISGRRVLSFKPSPVLKKVINPV
jgi:integration host factor subunit alpha